MTIHKKSNNNAVSTFFGISPHTVQFTLLLLKTSISAKHKEKNNLMHEKNFSYGYFLF